MTQPEILGCETNEVTIEDLRNGCRNPRSGMREAGGLQTVAVWEPYGTHYERGVTNANPAAMLTHRRFWIRRLPYSSESQAE